MIQVKEKLVRCFSAVFPDLTVDEISRGNIAALTEIDSWAGVTLIAVIDEEFGVSIEPEQLWELGTFQNIQEYLAKRIAGERAAG